MRILPSRLLERPRVRIAGEEPVAAGPRTVSLRIDGLVCGLCAARVTRALADVRGVERAEVDLTSGRATVALRGPLDPAALERAVENEVIFPRARAALARLSRRTR